MLVFTTVDFESGPPMPISDRAEGPNYLAYGFEKYGVVERRCEVSVWRFVENIGTRETSRRTCVGRFSTGQNFVCATLFKTVCKAN